MIKRLKNISKKFENALHGFIVMVKEEKSLWVHFIFTIIAIVLGIVLKISALDWVLISLSIVLVISFEIMNTAIEYLVDIVSFEYNVKAKKVKDVAATATLFVTLFAIAVGLWVFITAFQALLA